MRGDDGNAGAEPAAAEGRLVGDWGVALTLAAVVVLVLLHGASLWRERDEARRGAADKATLIANLAEEHARLMFHTARLATETAAQDFDDMDASVVASRADWLRLRSLTERTPGINRIVVFDADGWLRLESRDYPARRVNVSDRPYFQSHRDAAEPFLHIGPPIVSRISPDQVFPISRRLQTPAGRFNGIVSLGMQVKLFEDFYANLGIGNHGNLTLLRQDGVILAREPRPDGALGRRVDLDGIFPGFSEGHRSGLAIGASPVDGVERVFAYSTLEDFGVVLVAGVALEDAMGPWRNLMAATALTAGPALVLLVFMALRMRRTLGRLRAAVVERERLVLERDRANEDLQRFAQISAHHFQEPARRLVSYASLLRKRLPEAASTPETSQFLTHILEQAAHLRALVRDVQLYLTAERPRGSATWTDPREAVAAAERRLTDAIAASGAVITVGEVVAVPLEAQRLTEILVLLFENALSYGTGEARPEITVSGTREGTRPRLSVADNGPGVPPFYRERVFRVFERLQAGSGDGRPHTGIGLAIVRRVMASVGGEARLDEAPGGGAVVHLDFPGGEK